MIKRLLIGLITCSLCGIAAAETLQKAVESYNSGKYKISAEILGKLADSSPRAKGFLCLHYMEGLIDDKARGNSVCQDAVLAKDPATIFLYARALVDGNANIGVSRDLLKGLGFMSVAVIEFDFPPAYDFFCEYYGAQDKRKEAASFCKVGSSQNMRRSQMRMASLYTEGHGVLQDHKKAFDLLLLSASQNHGPAYEALGDIFVNGTHGKGKDFIQAHAWYSLAAAVKADRKIDAKQAALKLTPDQLISSQKLSKSWGSKEPKFANYFLN